MDAPRILRRNRFAWALQNEAMVALINLVLAVVAFAKDLLQAVYFGTSPSADALTLAFFVPDTLGNNLFACALSVACVPVFCKLLVEGDDQRLKRVFTQVTVYAVLLTGIGCLLVYLFPDAVLAVLGHGLQPQVIRECKQLLELLLPTMVLFPLWMIGSAALQSMGMFRAPAWAPVVYNAVAVAALAVLCAGHTAQKQGVWWAAVGLFAGTACACLVNLAALWRQGGRAWLGGYTSLRGNHGDVRQVARMFFPYLLILLCSQLIYTVERGLASTLGSGTIAGLNYAFRLASMPLWVFVAALTTVLLPSLARAIGEGEERQIRAMWNRAVCLTLVLTVPMSAGLCLLRVPIVRLLFLHGSFNEQSLRMTTAILFGYSLAIVPLALTAVGVRYYMAVERMRVPTGWALVAFLVNVLFDLLFTKTLGAAALGEGAAIGALVSAAGMMGMVYGDLRKRGKVGDEDGTISDRDSGVQ